MPLTSPSFIIQDSLFDIRYSNKHADTHTIMPRRALGDLRSIPGHSLREPNGLIAERAANFQRKKQSPRQVR